VKGSVRAAVARRTTPGTLTALLLAAVALFSLNEVVAQRTQAESLERLRTIVDNSAPSVIELVEARRAVRELRSDMLAASDAVADERPGHERRDADLLAQAETHLEAYLRLPVFPGELEARAGLRDAISELAPARDAVLAARDRETARRAFRENFAPKTDHIGQIVGALIELNALEASRTALDASSQQAYAQERSIVLFVAVSLALVALGLAVHRAVSRSQEETARRLEELDAFAARVAHDLRGPLSPVTVAIGLLRREPSLGEAQQRVLATADRSVARMVALIDGLLRFARAGARPEPGARALVDKVASEQVAALATFAQEERARVACEVEPGLEVAADPAVLGSIVENLVRNALFHLGESPQRDVVVRARVKGASVLLEVQDTGPGIPLDVARRLFRPFERGSDRPGGHGLGLATVKRLAEAHGGGVTLKSAVGVGSTFEVRLPRFGASSPS
jgi:signal transduction histidine kinase